MHQPLTRGRLSVLLILWACACTTLPIWCWIEPPAWDVAVYANAIHSLQAHHDPYADGIAVQRAFHATFAQHPHAVPPYTYVYSPLTLPVLALIGTVPFWLSGLLYAIAYFAGALSQVFVGLSCAQRGGDQDGGDQDAGNQHEWKYFIFLTPAALFFPAMLQNDTIQSGNVAYILYGSVLAAALYGWRRDRWLPFYLVTLAASCLKAPLLTLLVIPVFSARRQWLASAATAAAGLSLFVLQPLVWPALFRHYLEAVELQFSFNHDFGCSPASILSDYLWDHNLPYSPASLVFYCAYALPLLGMLFYLSRRFFRGEVTLGQWIPVLLVGTILLNPRVKEYDVVPLTLPIALIVYRFFNVLFKSIFGLERPTLKWYAFFGFFALANGFALSPLDNVWLLSAAPLLVFCFAAGSWTLLRTAAVSAVPLRAGSADAWSALRSSPQP